MFNSAFDGVGALAGDYEPLELRPEIDALNERIYTTVNNGSIAPVLQRRRKPMKKRCATSSQRSTCWKSG